MSDTLHLAEAAGSPREVPVSPQASQAGNEDAGRAVLDASDRSDVIDHALADRSIGQIEPARINGDQEFQRAFLGVDGDDPVTGREWMGVHVWMVMRLLIKAQADVCLCSPRRGDGGRVLKSGMPR
jgi:hypothetical protein